MSNYIIRHAQSLSINKVAVSRERWALRPNSTIPFQSYIYPDHNAINRLTLADAVGRVRQGEYEYVSTKKVRPDIYSELDEEILLGTGRLLDDTTWLGDRYLFAEQGIKSNTQSAFMWEFSSLDSQYLYIPVRDDYYSVVESLIPKVQWWHKDKTGLAFPRREHWLRVDKNLGEVYELIVDKLTHPFCRGLYLTGYVYVRGDGEPLYEYQDLEGLYDEPGQRYVSNLRPPQLDFPLGRPMGGELVKDNCPGEQGEFASWGNVWWLGTYTGYRTTELYHPTKVYYLYKRQDGSVYLHEASPHPEAWVWVQNLGGGMVIEGCRGYVSQELHLWSCGTSLVLEDMSYLPPDYEYVFMQDFLGDCVVVDDNYILGSNTRDNEYLNDRLVLDDTSRMQK